MTKKIHIVVILSIVLLGIFYLISCSFYLRYENQKKTFELEKKNLETTDLSELSFSGHRVGDVLGLLSKDFKGIVECENSKSYSNIGGVYETERVDSTIMRIYSELPPKSRIMYKGTYVDHVNILIDLLGENYICNANGTYTYIDHAHDIELSISTDEYRKLIAKRVDLPLYEKKAASILGYCYDPISVLDSTVYRWNFEFTDLDLILLPLFFGILSIPVLALIVYRNKKIVCVNLILLSIYFVLYCINYWNALMGI